MTTTTNKQQPFNLDEPGQQEGGAGGGRRRFLAGLGAGAIALGAGVVLGQGKGQNVTTVPTPPADFGTDAAPNVYFWDPNVLAVDPSFNGLAQPNAPIQR